MRCPAFARLETRATTWSLWGAVALYTLAFWIPRFLPLIDYPQHVAIAAILRRVATGSETERGLYEVGLITYNGGFHLLVCALSFLVQPETAGRLVVSSYPFLLTLSALALLDRAQRPRWYALFVVPITYSFAVGWGFANYFMSVPLAVLCFTWWLRAGAGERLGARLALASAVLAYTHVFATLCLCVSIGAWSICTWRASKETPAAKLRTLCLAPLPIWPAIVWCCIVFVHNRYSPHANWEGWDEGLDDPLWYKVLHFTSFSVGNFSDHSDQLIFAVALGTLIVLWQAPAPLAPTHRHMAILASLWGLLYCVIPKVFIASWFMFERIPTWIVLFAACAAPVMGRGQHRFRLVACVVALAAAVNTVWHFARIPDELEADQILDDIPEHSRVVAVTFGNHADPVISREIWVHLLAYYQARRPGMIGYSFAKFESMPVHYRLGMAPPLVPGGMEWDGRKYDVNAPFARFFNVVLVRTSDDMPLEDPRERTFAHMANQVRVLAHRGRFWLFERPVDDRGPP